MCLLWLISFAVGKWEGAVVDLEKMAKLVAFLSSDDAEFINGGEWRSIGRHRVGAVLIHLLVAIVTADGGITVN